MKKLLKLFIKLKESTQKIIIGLIIWIIPAMIYGFIDCYPNWFADLANRTGLLIMAWGGLQNLFQSITINNITQFADSSINRLIEILAENRSPKSNKKNNHAKNSKRTEGKN